MQTSGHAKQLTLNRTASKIILLNVAAPTFSLKTLHIGGLSPTPNTNSFRHKNPL
jgi:hypothetical protein